MIGELNTLITIKRPVLSNVYGEVQETWATVATVWAQVLPRGSREAYRAARVEGTMDYLIRCRARTDVTADCRITLGTRIFSLSSPPQDVTVHGTRMIEMFCVEVEA